MRQITRESFFGLGPGPAKSPPFVPRYFIRADGTAATKEDATGPATDASKCMSVATHNSETFLPGTQIAICASGGEYDDSTMPVGGLIAPSSGAPGAPIRYSPVGNVVMTQWDDAGAWTQQSGNIYRANQTIGSEFMMLIAIPSGETLSSTSKVLGRRCSTDAQMTQDGDWLWDSAGAYYAAEANRVYFYSDTGDANPNDPDDRYAMVGTTKSNRPTIVDLNGQDYITIDGLDDGTNSLLLSVADEFAISYDETDTGGQRGLTVLNVTAEYCGATGVRIGLYIGDLSIQGVEARECYRHGINVSAAPLGSSTNIKYCNVHDCCKGDKHFDSNLEYTSGIKVWGATTAQSGLMANSILEWNWVHDNGPGTNNQAADNSGDQGVGIWFDLTHGKDADNANHCRYNWVEDNSGNGIYVEKSHYTYSYYNICANNTDQDSGSNMAGIFLDSKVGKDCTYNKVIGNVCYGNSVGLKIVGDTSGGGEINYNEFINNIAYGNVNRALWVASGGDNLTYGTGNKYINNSFGEDSQARAFAQYSGSTYNDYSVMQTAANAIEADTMSHPEAIEADPLFTNAAAGQFYPMSNSPVLENGYDAGDAFINAMLSTADWPPTESAKTASQERSSTNWDIGAYKVSTG